MPDNKRKTFKNLKTFKNKKGGGTGILNFIKGVFKKNNKTLKRSPIKEKENEKHIYENRSIKSSGSYHRLNIGPRTEEQKKISPRNVKENDFNRLNRNLIVNDPKKKTSSKKKSSSKKNTSTKKVSPEKVKTPSIKKKSVKTLIKYYNSLNKK